MPEWKLIGVTYGEREGSHRAIYHRHLADGAVLAARVRNAEGRPEVDEITARFPNGARDFGREIAVAELERVINDNETWSFPDARTGEPVSIFVFSEIPVGVPLRGSRGRKVKWTDRLLAELVRDLESDKEKRWYLERNTLRERANEAVRRGIAEVAAERPLKRWRLTARGREILRRGTA
jgi:hypothetical protein